MNEYIARISEAVEATIIHSSASFSWFGLRFSSLPRGMQRSIPERILQQYLLAGLQSRLYQSFYCRGEAYPCEEDLAKGAVVKGDPAFVDKLSRANLGEGYWSSGWQVGMVKGKHVVISQDGLSLRVAPEICQAQGKGDIHPGAPVNVRFPKEREAEWPGYYMAYGNLELTIERTHPLLRVYFNLTPGGAVKWMRLATSALNDRHIPFQLKVRNDPDQFRRCDVVVLYVNGGSYDSFAELMEQLHPRIADQLKPRIPAFCKRLADGIGLAEDPATGGSFGLHRCRILAEGIIRAHEQRRRAMPARMDAVLGCFGEYGINTHETFLNPGSTDVYRLLRPVTASAATGSSTTFGSSQETLSQAYLRSAAKIGERLAHEAVWYGDSCNWLGYASRPLATDAGSAYMALGPDLYGGTGGVALFLAETYDVTGESNLRRAARGGMEHALSNLDALPAAACLGLYTGWVGIAVTAARIGVLLCDDGLVTRSRKILKSVRQEYRNQEALELDLLSGKAGAIVGLIILHAVLKDAGALELAEQLGDDLLRDADQDGQGLSWKTSASPSGRNLTGLSHGASGVAYALLELFRVTGASRFLAGAEGGFAYERRWFDAREQNWPDFSQRQGRLGRAAVPSFSTQWCHGAPGIALARLRAFETTKDASYKTEAIAALHTTRHKADLWLRSGDANYSLCHGLLGLAGVLDHGAQVLGSERRDDAAQTREVANSGMARHSQSARGWPCGIAAGETPGLMLGLAGIGHFYLRLHRPALPSVLMIRPEEFTSQPPEAPLVVGSPP